MSQPTHTLAELRQWTTDKLAARLDDWAHVREKLRPERERSGRDALSTALLRAAAERLREKCPRAEQRPWERADNAQAHGRLG